LTKTDFDIILVQASSPHLECLKAAVVSICKKDAQEAARSCGRAPAGRIE